MDLSMADVAPVVLFASTYKYGVPSASVPKIVVRLPLVKSAVV